MSQQRNLLQFFNDGQKNDTKRPPPTQQDEDDIEVTVKPKKHKQDHDNTASVKSLHGNDILVDDIQDSSDDEQPTTAQQPPLQSTVTNSVFHAPMPHRNTSSTLSSQKEHIDDAGAARWFWQTDTKSWEEYTPEFCLLLEAVFLGDKGEVKVDNQRFVDVRYMLQRRYDDRNKVRSVRREPSEAQDTSQYGNKKGTFSYTTSKAGSKVANDGTNKSISNKNNSNKNSSSKSSSTNNSSNKSSSINNCTSSINNSNKSTTSSKDNTDTKTSDSGNSQPVAKWYWQSDNGWVVYDDKTSQKLERGYLESEENVQIDGARFVDLKVMVQRRFDQPTRMRPIRRECKPSHSDTTSTAKAQTKQHIVSSPQKITPQVSTAPPFNKNSNAQKHSEKNKVTTHAQSVDKGKKLVVQWLWLSDDKQWHTYDTTTAAILEEEYCKGSKEARVDEERYVDLENMLQRRFDNENKKRYIKRLVHLTKEQKERAERNRQAALEKLEKLKAKGQTSILSFLPTPFSSTQKTSTTKNSQLPPQSPDHSDGENDAHGKKWNDSDVRQSEASDEERNEKSDGEEANEASDGEDETKVLENRRQRYKCGEDYITLHQIETWESTLVRLISSGKGVEHAEHKPNPSLNKKVSLWCGDITTLEIDAIVNAAKPSLLGGGGIDGAIHSAAGKGLLHECMLLDGCDVGDTKITAGHLLPARFVLHTVGPVGEDPDALTQCYTSTLDLAAQYSIRSVAFCCVSTGIYGYPNDKAARVALSTVRKWLNKHNTDSIDRIIFCVFLDKDHALYSKLMQSYFPPPSTPQPSASTTSSYTNYNDDNDDM